MWRTYSNPDPHGTTQTGSDTDRKWYRQEVIQTGSDIYRKWYRQDVTWKFVLISVVYIHCTRNDTDRSDIDKKWHRYFTSLSSLSILTAPNKTHTRRHRTSRGKRNKSMEYTCLWETKQDYCPYKMTKIMNSIQSHKSYRKTNQRMGIHGPLNIWGGIRCHGGVNIPCWPVTPAVSPISTLDKRYDP
jgi:hypothetical protein